MDREVTRLVSRLRLPEDWRGRLAELANHHEERQAVEGKRHYLDGKLRRLRDLYLEGISESKYIAPKSGAAEPT